MSEKVAETKPKHVLDLLWDENRILQARAERAEQAERDARADEHYLTLIAAQVCSITGTDEEYARHPQEILAVATVAAEHAEDLRRELKQVREQVKRECDEVLAELEALAVAAADYRDALDGVFEAEQVAGPQEASLWNALGKPSVKALIERARAAGTKP